MAGCSFSPITTLSPLLIYGNVKERVLFLTFNIEYKRGPGLTFAAEFEGITVGNERRCEVYAVAGSLGFLRVGGFHIESAELGSDIHLCFRVRSKRSSTARAVTLMSDK